jgi:putative membrane protein
MRHIKEFSRMKKYLATTMLAVPLLFGGGAWAQSASTMAPAAPSAVAPTPPVAPAPQAEAKSPAPESAAHLSAADKAFVEKAGQGGIAEVQMADMAEKNADNADVKSFAQTMIDDHTPNNQQLANLATAKGLTAPTEPNAMQQKMMTHLQGLNGAAFDRAYINGQVKAHTMMLKLFRMEAKTTKDPDLKYFATTTASVVEHHLSMAQGLQKSGV